MANIVTFKFNLGDFLKDRITGFKGYCTGTIEYLNGCKQYCVKPNKLKDNIDTIEGKWIDEGQLVKIEGHGLYDITDVQEEKKEEGPGGPQSDCPKDRSN